ncbi:MAG: hypothetical protein OCD76_00360 [Reichenbachiella sp.]
MQQKIIYLLFLITGISLIISSCGETEYPLDVDLIFINQTDSLIIYNDQFEIVPNATYKESIESTAGSEKKPNIDNCCQGTLEDFQGSYQQVIISIESDDSCVFFSFSEDQGPTSINNFESRVISDRHFEYTYHITRDDFNNPERCD